MTQLKHVTQLMTGCALSNKAGNKTFYNLFVDTASKIDRHLLSTVASTGFFLFTNTVNYNKNGILRFSKLETAI